MGFGLGRGGARGRCRPRAGQDPHLVVQFVGGATIAEGALVEERAGGAGRRRGRGRGWWRGGRRGGECEGGGAFGADPCAEGTGLGGYGAEAGAEGLEQGHELVGDFEARGADAELRGEGGELREAAARG